LTPTGKLDRRALPEPLPQSGHFIAPRTPAEEMLCELLASVLSLDRVGAEDNFFALGGHSLIAARLASRLRANAGVDVSVRDIFLTRTLAELAAVIESRLTERRAYEATDSHAEYEFEDRYL
jgi:acyl carrier protein